MKAIRWSPPIAYAATSTATRSGGTAITGPFTTVYGGLARRPQGELDAATAFACQRKAERPDRPVTQVARVACSSSATTR